MPTPPSLQPAAPAAAQPGPHGPASIERIVIVMCENRTYDNVASDVVGGDGAPWLPLGGDVEDGCWNGHPAWMRRAQLANRKRYTRAELPALHTLMDMYTVCDRYFSDFSGDSFSNHLFAVAADNLGVVQDPTRRPRLSGPTLPLSLQAAGRSWAQYGKDDSFAAFTDPRMHANQREVDQFAADCANGTLPDVSWVFPGFGRDFHPANGPIQQSDAWLRTAVQAVADGRLSDGRELWNHVHLWVVFDEWGGWFDHVTPPVAERMANGDPLRYGSRVPCVSVGPYARPGHVSHQLGSHVSLVAATERHFGLAPLNARTASRREYALSDAIDLHQPPRERPRWLESHCSIGGWSPASTEVRRGLRLARHVLHEHGL